MTNFTVRTTHRSLIMSQSAFNPAQQEKDISSKIVAGMERISEVFKILLWEKSKIVGLSPIQIQILIFIEYHHRGLCNVSHLAKEFNVTKPTISDAIKILDKKGLIIKDFSSYDSRRYSILLSDRGNEIIKQTQNFSEPLKKEIATFSPAELEELSGTLNQLIFQLNRKGILTVQRTCFGCDFYSKHGNKDYCNLLEKELMTSDIRLDCPEYVEKT